MLAQDTNMSLCPTLEICSLTHPGMVRAHNEDNHVVDAAGRFAILADGMGGYNAGEVASEMAVTLLAAGLSGSVPDRKLLLKTQIERSNAAIFAASQTRAECAGMGTTLVAAMFHDNRVTVAHVGDSRLYRCRGEHLEVITRDHSLLQEQIDGGLISREEARMSSNKNLVTRALGVAPEVAVEVGEYPTLAGDVYLLCSDGLNDMVTDIHIQQVLLGNGSLQDRAQQLVQTANANGGRDNVTVILVRLLQEPA